MVVCCHEETKFGRVLRIIATLVIAPFFYSIIIIVRIIRPEFFEVCQVCREAVYRWQEVVRVEKPIIYSEMNFPDITIWHLKCYNKLSKKERKK